MAGESQIGFELKVAGEMFAGLEQYMAAAPADEATIGLLSQFRRESRPLSPESWPI